MTSMVTLANFSKAIRILFAGKPDERRRVRQEAARLGAGLSGDFYLGDGHKIWLEDQSFVEKTQFTLPE